MSRFLSFLDIFNRDLCDFRTTIGTALDLTQGLEFKLIVLLVEAATLVRILFVDFISSDIHYLVGV